LSTVRYSGPTNSTFFTTCCKVAICDDQQVCPRCREDVYPFYKGMSEEDRRQAAGGYYNHNTRMSRMSAARGQGYV
jgi:hypothetical protein